MDLQNQTITTFMWNINHTQIMVVEEWCVYCMSSENRGWTETHQEAWVSSRVPPELSRNLASLYYKVL